MKNYKLLELDKVDQICNKNTETIIKNHCPLKVRPHYFWLRAWLAARELEEHWKKPHEVTSNRSDEFSFLFSYHYISPQSTIVSMQWILRVTFLFSFLSSMLIGIVTIQINWVMYSNLTQQCWTNCIDSGWVLFVKLSWMKFQTPLKTIPTSQVYLQNTAPVSWHRWIMDALQQATTSLKF